MNIDTLNKIYNAFGDEKSRKIFENRLMYSISGGGIEYLRNIVLQNKKIKDFKDEIKKCKTNDMVIFGAGEAGKRLYLLFEGITWKYFVDSNTKNMKDSKIGNVPIISYDKFIENYQGEYIVISSLIHHKKMVEQLNKDGIYERIIDLGEIKESLTHYQYFDLEYLQPAVGKEIFVDVGCYNGMSSVDFQKWSKGNSFVYAFEPNFRQIEECKRNLENSGVNYKIINKGAWIEEDTLHFMLTEHKMSSRIREDGEEIVNVTSLDKELGDEKVTFIKMDIEGSELPAIIGAKNIIIKNKPKLAISVYHKYEDIFEIPEIILKYNPNYKIYLRHYATSDSETILYALPE